MPTIEQIKRLIERVKNPDDVQLINDDGKLNYGDVYDFDWSQAHKHNESDIRELLRWYPEDKQK